MNYGLVAIIIIISTSIGAFFGLKHGNLKYNNEDMLKVIHFYNKIIKEYKEDHDEAKNHRGSSTTTDGAATQSEGPRHLHGYVPPKFGGIGSIQYPDSTDI